MRLATFLILGILLIGASIGARAFPKYKDRHGGSEIDLRFAWLLLKGGLLFGLALCCIAIIQPRTVGVQVVLGKTAGTLDSGPHVIVPWSTVKNFPATIQTFRLQGDGKDVDGPCVTVRLANQTTACVNVTTQWQIDTTEKKAVQALYARWRSFDNIEPNLIRPQLQHALLAPFEGYDPLQVLKANGSLVAPTAELEQKARVELENAVGDGIHIQGLTINLVNYDQTTQDKVNAYSQAVADTRIAEQRKSTAEAQRQANDALAGSAASKDPAVIQQNCIDMTERMAKEGKPLPAAWSCGINPTAVVPVR